MFLLYVHAASKIKYYVFPPSVWILINLLYEHKKVRRQLSQFKAASLPKLCDWDIVMYSLHQDAEELLNCINKHVQGGGRGNKTLPCDLLHLGLISAANVSLGFRAEG